MPRRSEKPEKPSGSSANNAPNLTTSRLRRFINALPAGATFTTADCMQYGPRTSVDKALSRLTAVGSVIRVAYGVFVRNDNNQQLPSVSEIAQAKARAFGKRIYEHGQDIAKRLNLVEKPNREPTYLVHGGSSSFNTVHSRVRFVGTSPRKTRNRGTKSADLLAALWHLGKDEVTIETVQKATYEFFRPDSEELRSSAGLVPAWLGRLISRRWNWRPPVMVNA